MKVMFEIQVIGEIKAARGLRLNPKMSTLLYESFAPFTLSFSGNGPAGESSD
jgi:hypothetical protein